MRIVLTSALAILVAAPAAAQQAAPSSPPPAAPSVADVGAALSNPVVQDGLAQIVTGVADAVLATRVGPLARYTDPDGDIRPDDTLGDLEARRDPDYRRHLQDRTRSSVAAVGRTARDAGVIAAELKATSERLRAALAPVVAALASYGHDGAADHY
jgi:hypothetical protein